MSLTKIDKLKRVFKLSSIGKLEKKHTDEKSLRMPLSQKEKYE